MIQTFWCWILRLRKYSLTNEKWFFLFFMCNFGAYSGASLLKFPPSQAISCHCTGHYFYLHFLMPANPSAELRSRFKMACSASSYTSYWVITCRPNPPRDPEQVGMREWDQLGAFEITSLKKSQIFTQWFAQVHLFQTGCHYCGRVSSKNCHVRGDVLL